ncbi:hypothetical protein ACQP2T_18385 [Nonomuraea sp. CA-143628]|uniref:hypothetical protein n=1 Tax=Nonomuraea sp. CA-143628 TaxID=3239997 RepID=UPI003D915832
MSRPAVRAPRPFRESGPYGFTDTMSRATEAPTPAGSAVGTGLVRVVVTDQ